MRDAVDRGAEELWTIMPFVDRWDLTHRAALDVQAQNGVTPRLLLIDNGGTVDTRARAEDHCAIWTEHRPLLWSHNPPLPSLAATWNRALDFVWAAGGERAWVVNNDIRLHRDTAMMLLRVQTRTQGLFVTAVGVTEEQFNPDAVMLVQYAEAFSSKLASPGGPDFSCYIITKECHSRYRFDENFTPAYCEDLDYHRRMMLGGDGRLIFSVNIPFLHVDRGSGTLKGMGELARRLKEEAIEAGSRTYYRKKWGGGVNQEIFTVPFGTSLLGGPGAQPTRTFPLTTPELQKETWREKADL